MINKIFFSYFAITIITLSIIVISRRNVMHSIIYMLALFFHIAGLYLFLNAEFIAAIQIIVYAGAILVLFLFVIMLLNIRHEIKEQRYIGEWPVALAITISLLIVFIISAESLKVGKKGIWGIQEITDMTHTMAIGKVLYTEYLFPFEVASLILLIAIIGAVVLAKRKVK